MAKLALPTYSICSLMETPGSPSEFMADRFSHYLEMHRDLQFPHKHSFYHLVYFSKGSGRHSIDFIQFPVEPGQLYFMIPGQVHTWDFKNVPDGFIINFSGEFLAQLLANPRYLDQFTFFSGIANEQVIKIPAKSRVKIEELLESIIVEANSSKEMKDDMARAALVQLFIEVGRCAGHVKGTSSNSYNLILLRNFQKLIDKHYREKRLTKEYAAMLYITPNHLNALSKDVSGKSAGELIRDRVILEAKRLLVNAELTITEIAHELDFSDNSYFSKFFRKYAGVTPEVFRQKIHKT